MITLSWMDKLREIQVHYKSAGAILKHFERYGNECESKLTDLMARRVNGEDIWEEGK